MNFYAMEGAPTDGRWVLLETAHHVLYIARWSHGMWLEARSGNGEVVDAIGWFPLQNP